FFVKALVETASAKSSPKKEIRRQTAQGCLFYHILLSGLLASMPVLLGWAVGVCIIVAFGPALVRGFQILRRIPGESISLKRVGLAEMGYALWFCAWLVACLRLM
ncbi:MAG: hypothetical protein O2954_18050, partial [bacterium]|nr:hypothetical protein [bacterium]